MKYSFTLFTLLCIASVVLNAQPGTLDKSFGDGGIVIGKTYYGECNDLLSQQDGKIIAIGRGTYNGLASGFLLVRYNADGTPDLSFGDSGRVATSPSAGGNYGAYGALQQDGKIIVAGEISAKPALIRYNSNGNLDSSFGKNGIVVQPLSKIYENPTGLSIQPDGKILLSGTDEANSEVENFWAIYIIRYNPDGSLDETFGKGGIREEEVYPAISTAGIAIQPDGNIIIGGNYPTSSGHPFFIRRYTKDGTPDKSFGINGEARYNFTGFNGSYIYSIALQTDSKIIAAGSLYGVRNDGNPQSTMVRFEANGSIDNSFGQHGLVTTQIGESGSEMHDIALQPDGKIVTAANSMDIYNRGNIAFATVRYLNNGEPDSSFAHNGVQLTVIQNQPIAKTVVLMENGKILLSGYTIDDSQYSRVTLARYNGDNNKQPILVRIKRWLQHYGISWQGVQGGNNIRYYTVQRSTDGIVFKDIAKVSSKVNTYEDAAINSNSFYRIAAISWDESRTYSNTILIDDGRQPRIYPNPVRSNLNLQGLPATGKTSVSVLDLSGNLRSITTATSSNYSINTANISAGSYLLKIQHGVTITMLPFVKE